MGQSIVMVVGLGNPGPEYANTRHNAGALIVDALAREAGQPLRPERKYLGNHARIHWQGCDVHLLNPTTFMNRSGQSVKALADFFKIAPEQILVAHDELDLPPGTARLKQGGGHGGHNGLRDIIAHLGTKEFQRLRVGIGHPGDAKKVTGYVLSRLTKSDARHLDEIAGDILRVLPDAIQGDLPKAQNHLHTIQPST
ncbi:aminoacyl-tRNA hydrolase [Tamilnaduibacter salinus]|uniref:Peptidyl-tRNA hydrolase n=1 Tax=Tamilnaduibacter salinus TaxID=1484056 RepID=A0A2A2I5F2_9GAMM|nr:aminoacyl-tRNA hydrolase [Tamilnaduibacter salinus]PAV27241.1 aminoacyl-tRNA hydrolase [Tamilnaduibacter salinus]